MNCRSVVAGMSERPDFLELLDQDELWWPAEGPPIRLEEMGPRHKRNTLAWLRRRAADEWPLIQYEAMNPRAPHEVQQDAWCTTAEQFADESPLIARLTELVAADRAAGVPDEPDQRIGKPLPCAHWCLTCRDMERESPLIPGGPLACASCPDCTPALAAADDATWD